jgi:predicted Zn finger-like uncharacterized protein
MIAQCPTCESKYRVADAKVSPGGTKFKCKKCKGTFTVFREPQQQAEEAPARRAPTMRNCPHCGKPIPMQAIKCRHCREAVDQAAASFEDQEADAPVGDHADPFVPQAGPGADHQDPFAPKSEQYAPQGNAFDSDEEGGFGGAPGYGGPPPPGGPSGGGYGGGPPHQQQTMPAGGVPNYLAQAILVTLFCCLPFGIVSIVYAAQVNGKLSGGDVAGAVESSEKAKKWCWISFVLGLIPAVIWAILMMLGVAVQV